MFVSRWCYKSGPLKVIGHFSRESVGRKTRVQLVSSHWWVLVSFDSSIVSQTKSFCMRSVYC